MTLVPAMASALGVLAAGAVVWLVIGRARRIAVADPDSIPFATSFVTVGPWRWRVHRSGRGPTVLLLHGLGANLYCWRTLVAGLGPRFDVIAPDLPGFGQTSILDDQAYGLDDQVPRVIALLDELRVDRCFVVGNSMGGNIALWLALKHPDRVRALAVIAPAASPRLIPPGLTFMHWAAIPLSLFASRAAITWFYGRTVSRPNLMDRERVDDALKTYARQHRAVRSLLRATQAIRDPRLPHALAEVRTPALILWGSRDRLVSREVIDALETLLPTARSFVHLGGGHHLQEDEPEWTSEKLTRFFGEFQD